MMGRRSGDQASLFYEFRLDDRVPKNHLLRRINLFVKAALADMHERLQPYYSEIGRPSVDPELMIRMLPGAVDEQLRHRTEIALLQCDETDRPARFGQFYRQRF
jgi:hypothetical protein